MTILFTWPTPTEEFGLIDWLTTEDTFSPRDGMWPTIAACLWSHAPPVSLAVSESVWSKKEQPSVHCMMPSFCMHSRQGSSVNHATIRAQERNALHIFTQHWPFKSRNCTYFGDNNGRDIASRQLPKITAQGENHGSHGDREFVIYIHPHISIINLKMKTDSIWINFYSDG